MSIVRACSVALVILAQVAPALAEKNRNDYAFSAEGQRQLQKNSYCAQMKVLFDAAENEADAHSGKKSAEPYAKQADDLWTQAASRGCSWAR